MQARTSTITLSLRDERATRELAASVAGVCRPGTVLLLRGPLGAGKTTFVDGLTQAIGGGSATSPTFVIAHSYPGGRIPVWHLDLYRLSEPAAVAELDLEQYLDAAAITVVEWPERAPDVWPPERMEIELRIVGDGREAVLSGFDGAADIVTALRARVHG